MMKTREELAFGVGNTEAARDLDKRHSDKTVEYESDWMVFDKGWEPQHWK